jgi:hypothetical protein
LSFGSPKVHSVLPSILKHGPKKSGNTNDMIKDPTINSAMRKIKSDSTPAIEKLARKSKREE